MSSNYSPYDEKDTERLQAMIDFVNWLYDELDSDEKAGHTKGVLMAEYDGLTSHKRMLERLTK